MSLNLSKIIMAELSDSRFDARVLRQAVSLSKNQYNIVLIMYNSNISNRAQTKINKNMELIEIPFKKRYDSSKKTSTVLKIFNFITVMISYFFLIMRQKGNCYHAHNYFVGWMLYVSSKLHGGKFIYDCHELIWAEHSFHFKIGILLEKYLLKHSVLNICPSEERSKLIKEYYNLKSELLAIYNYPVKREVSINEEYDIKRIFGIQNNCKIMLYTGSYLTTTRMQVNVVKSMCLLPSNVYFLLIGFGHSWEINLLKNTAEASGVSDRLIFMEPVKNEKLLAYSMSCDIGISLLKDAGLSYQYHALNKFYDYSMAGLAILASNFPTFVNDIKNNNEGSIGEVCNPEDPEDIAMALSKLIDSPSYLLSCKMNSKILAEKKWNWEKEEKKLISGYRSIQCVG